MSAYALLPSNASLPDSRPLQSAPCTDDVYARVLDAIVDQRLPPDSRLNEERLGREFGVSRLQIRHALSLLTYQHVITLQAKVGARIASPSDEQICQALHARRLTETALIPMACQRAQRPDIDHLHHLIERQRQAYADNQRGRAIRLAGAFHLHLGHMAGNAPLAHFLANLIPMTSLAIARRSDGPEAWQQQVAMANAVENKDEVTALALLNHYLGELVPG